MDAFTWLNVCICEYLDKFQLFFFYEQVQVCIVSARCVLTESISTHKLRRDNVKLYVQGVHSVLKVCVTEFYLTWKVLGRYLEGVCRFDTWKSIEKSL